MVKALIFDVDGTIAETEELHRKAYNSIFSDEGISWNWSKKLYKELLKVTGGKERLKHYKENFTSKNYHLNINCTCSNKFDCWNRSNKNYSTCYPTILID